MVGNRIDLKNLLVLLVTCVVSTVPSGLSVASDGGEAGKIKGIKIESFQRTVGESTVWTQIRVKSDTPVNNTWAVLRNVGEWDKFVGLFPRSEIIESTGESKLVCFLVSPPWPLKDFPCVVEAREVPDIHVINWNMKEGHLTRNFGTISVEGLDGGSRIIYESTGPAKNAFPNWAVKIGVSIVLPGILKEFYQRIQEYPGLVKQGTPP